MTIKAIYFCSFGTLVTNNSQKMSNKQEKVYFSFNTREQTRIGMDDE